MTVSDRQTTIRRQPTMRTKTLGYVPCWKTGQRAYHRTIKREDVESNVVVGNVIASSGDEALAVAKPLLAQPTPVGYFGHFFWPTGS
jgi:hypothetical protein